MNSKRSSIAKSIYTEDWVRNLMQQISSFVREHDEWIAQPREGGWRVLDYACGGGIASMVRGSPKLSD
jgi:hypothetical protein